MVKLFGLFVSLFGCLFVCLVVGFVVVVLDLIWIVEDDWDILVCYVYDEGVWVGFEKWNCVVVNWKYEVWVECFCEVGGFVVVYYD